MTNPVPADVHALVGAYAIDALSDDERTDFEAHLAHCGECQDEVASLREAAHQLTRTTEALPSHQLRGRLLDLVASTEQEPAPEPAAAPGPMGTGATAATAAPAATDPTPEGTEKAEKAEADVVVLPRRKVRLAMLAAVAAVITAIALGSTVVDYLQHDDPPQATPTLVERIQAAEDAEEVTIEFPDGAKATVVRSTSLGRAMIVTENMPAPPPDSVYQLWFEDVDDGMVSAGVMPAVSDQTFLLQGQAEEARAVGITVEPTGGSLRPTTQQTVALFEFPPAQT